MAKLKETIKTEIKDHIRECSGSYSDWYVGIASDPKDRLFNEHNVDRENGTWIYRECESSSIAREIEEYFVELGTDGGFGGGDYTTKLVYAYKKTASTNE